MPLVSRQDGVLLATVLHPMTRLNQVIALFAACSGLLSQAVASDRWETLHAINLVENPTNHARYGSKGELGPYQFRPPTWRMHTREPFTKAVNREQADAVAVRHYEWIRQGLKQAGIDPNPYNIALAWNSGLGAVVTGRVPQVTYNYAQRVENLVTSIKQQRPDHSRPVVAATRLPVFSVETSGDFGVRFAPPVPSGPRFSIDPAPAASVAVLAVEQADLDDITWRAVPKLDLSVEKPLFSVALATSVVAPRFALIN